MRTALRIALATAALLATGIGPAHAQVPPGFDLFETDPEATVFHFREEFTIPPNFFGEGSEAFAGALPFGGEPINRFDGTRVGNADTVVRRPEAAQTSSGQQDTVPIQLVSLNLASVQPLPVTYNGQLRELWDVKVGLSPAQESQGALRVQQSGSGGTFDSRLQVVPVFDFQRICVIGRRRIGRRLRDICPREANGPTRRIDVSQLPLSDQARQQLVLGADNVLWGPQCTLPALPLPGLNDGFCPGIDPAGQPTLTVEGSRLAKHGIRPTPPPSEHFKCYTSRPERPFRRRTVTLTDQFGAERARVDAPRSLCAPARKNQEERVDNPKAHLQCYAIRRAERRVTPPEVVWIRNQFGPQDLRIGSPHRLCVPSLKSRTRRPPTPADPPVERTLDHFKCYFARPGLVTWTRRTILARDQFGARRLVLRPPTEICLPAQKNATRSHYPVRHLVCYPATHQMRPKPVRIDNQFGTQFLRVVKPFRFCVPSVKTWRAIPPPEQPPPPTETPPNQPPPNQPPPNDPPPPAFEGSGRFEPFNPAEVTFVIRFNQRTNGFRIVVPGNRTITNDLPPNGFTCQANGSAYDCTGDLPANTDASGRLQTNPEPQAGMGGQLFGRRNGTVDGPFQMTGP